MIVMGVVTTAAAPREWVVARSLCGSTRLVDSWLNGLGRWVWVGSKLLWRDVVSRL